MPVRPRRPRSLSPALVLVLVLLASAAGAASDRIEVRIQVPGIGQPVANGLYLFKFAVVDENSNTLWSNDGSSVRGDEPDAGIELFVVNGAVDVTLGEPPSSSVQPLPQEVLRREDVVLRTWVGGPASPSFRRLGDRKIGGRGFAFAAEQARNAERLEGRRAADFEAAGSVRRHEREFPHAPPGRFYQASLDLGAGREARLHFDVPRDDARLTLTLHASAPVGPPALTDLKLEVATAENQAVDSQVDVVRRDGPGWLAGLRESYDFCNSCFKRKLPPVTAVILDGLPFEGWKTGRRDITESAALGRFDHLAPLGLVRFRRSLQVTSRHQGVDQATGTTTVWYYTVDPAASGTPGAIQVLLNGGDVTAALVGLPEARASLRSSAGRMLASRFDGEIPPADALDPSVFLTRPADETWMVREPRVQAGVESAGATLLLVGELRLEAGARRIGLEGSHPATLELLLDGRYQRVVSLAAAGLADATVPAPASGWYQVRLLVAGRDGEVSGAIRVDGEVPQVRTVPLLGGEGTEPWSAGPLVLGDAGIRLGTGSHELTLRERSGRHGHLQYSLLVE